MRGFIVSRADRQSIPETIEVPYATGEAFEVGALGTIVDDEFVEATSPVNDSAAATHVTESPAGAPVTTPPYAGFGLVGGERAFPPGKVLLTEIKPEVTKMRCRFTGALPATTGGLFEAQTDANGYWILDFGAAGPFRYLRTVLDLPGETGPGSAATEVEVELVAGITTA